MNREDLKNTLNKFMPSIVFTSEMASNPEKYLGKEMYVLGYDYKEKQIDYDVYFNREEAENAYNVRAIYNKNKDYSYTLDKCIVRESELETIENLKNSYNAEDYDNEYPDEEEM